MFALPFFGHPGPHTTEGISHYLSGWHLMMLVLVISAFAGIYYMGSLMLKRKTAKETEDIEQQ